MPSIRAAARTDIGRVRRNNEDRYLCDPSLGLFGVADGIGGLPGGADAAQLAIDELTAALGDPTLPDKALVGIVQQVSRAVAELGHQLSPSLGIGCTLTLGWLRPTALLVAHVGDSRGYALRGRDFFRITEDHTVENDARRRRARGEITYYPEVNRQALTRCIGQPGRVEVDAVVRPLVAGERYLFCTDGVSRMLTDADLAALLGQSPDPETAVEEIVQLAVSRGGPDNATAVAVFIDEV